MPAKKIEDGYTAKDIYEVLDRIDAHIQEFDIDMTRLPNHMPTPNLVDIEQSLDSLDGTLAGIYDELKDLNGSLKAALELVSGIFLLREKRNGHYRPENE
jgi:hypothetical protein